MSNFIYTAPTKKMAREMNETKRFLGHITDEQYVLNKELIRKEFDEPKVTATSELIDPCPRCSGDKSKGQTCSMFNLEMICLSCLEKEKLHPDYERARDEERVAVLAGNFNFAGIGKPADL